MTGFSIRENHGDSVVEYRIRKTGSFSASITATIDGDPIIEDVNFTTAAELSSALHRAQVAVLIRMGSSMAHRSMEDNGAQRFIKYAVEHLKKMTHGSSHQDTAK